MPPISIVDNIRNNNSFLIAEAALDISAPKYFGNVEFTAVSIPKEDIALKKNTRLRIDAYIPFNWEPRNFAIIIERRKIKTYSSDLPTWFQKNPLAMRLISFI
ncbi:MAG: hypothetical protein IGBAC_0571 [Ignavibacteriae bacterium]|nr:MAG: hypothetical protein IGBAC_0571 [Ignavibacteriota bacterium]